MKNNEAATIADAIAHLRTLQPIQRAVPSAAQIELIVKDVEDVMPLRATMARPEMANLTVEDVLDVAELLGKYLARSLKLRLVDGDKPGCENPERVREPGERRVTYYAFSEGGRLFLPSKSETQEALKALRVRIRNKWDEGKRTQAKRRRAWARQLLKGLLPSNFDPRLDLLVCTPDGYEKDDTRRREILRSLAWLSIADVTPAVVERFWHRSYGSNASPRTLEADHVYVLHCLAVNKQAQVLCDLTGENYDLAQLLLEAHDTLDAARTGALEALADLIRAAESGTVDSGTVKHAAARARWLAPLEFDRLAAVVAEAERNPGNDRMAAILTTKLGHFTNWVKANPSTFFAVRSVEDMTLAHVRMILSDAGLIAAEDEERRVALELRATLTEMGLERDLDKEIPEGMRAWRRGKLDQFLTARRARVDGDPDWASLLDDELVAS